MKNLLRDRKKVGKIIENGKIAVTFLIAIIVFVIFVIYGMAKEYGLKLTIGTEDISEEEFLQAMSVEKHAVTQYFYKKYGAEIDKDFWLREYEGEAPYKMLADNTIETLLYIHAAYEIAKEKGYIDSVNYHDLLKRFEEENKMRAEKIENGEPIYGLVEFSLDIFIEYEMDRLQKMYVNDFTNEGISISDEEGKKYYEENRDRLFVKNDDFEIEFIKIYYAALDLEESEVNALKKDLNEVSKKLTGNTTLGSIVSNYPSLESYYEHMEILSEEVSARSREMGDVLELAAELENGESTQVIDQNGCLYLISIIKRINNDYVSYEQVRDVIVKNLREENFNQLVAKKAEQLFISGDMKGIYEFTKKQLKK